MDKGKAKGGKKKQKTVPETGIAHIQATFNNTLVTISDTSGHRGTWFPGRVPGRRVSRVPGKAHRSRRR